MKRVEDGQLAAVVAMIQTRAEAANMTGEELTLDAQEMLALDLYDARQELKRIACRCGREHNCEEGYLIADMEDMDETPHTH